MDWYVYAFLNSSDISSSTFPTSTQNFKKISSLARPQPVAILWSPLSEQCSSGIKSKFFWTLTLSPPQIRPFSLSPHAFLSSSLLVPSLHAHLPFLRPWLPSQASVLPYFFRRHLLNSTSMRRHPSSSFVPPFSYTSHPTQPESNTSHASHAQPALTTFQNDKIRRPHQWRWRLD